MVKLLSGLKRSRLDRAAPAASHSSSLCDQMPPVVRADGQENRASSPDSGLTVRGDRCHLAPVGLMGICGPPDGPSHAVLMGECHSFAVVTFIVVRQTIRGPGRPGSTVSPEVCKSLSPFSLSLPLSLTTLFFSLCPGERIEQAKISFCACDAQHTSGPGFTCKFGGVTPLTSPENP